MTANITEQQGTFPLNSYRFLPPEELTARIHKAREKLGSELLILAHNYQRDEIVAFADVQGDSLYLSQKAAENRSCRMIIFCGVHFMAETADILVNRPDRVAERGGRAPVVLPDLDAGCSLADMASIAQVEECWQQLLELCGDDDIIPVTYINSSAAIKAFCGRHDGIVCTSANAAAVLRWSLARKRRVLFLPDQHLGRNTGLRMGIKLEEMPLWNPHAPAGGQEPQVWQQARIILWKGHCCVHQAFRPDHIQSFRQKYPDIRIIVHPECPMEVAELADYIGSTSQIVKTIREASPGSRWAIGTEVHLVNRLKNEHPDKEIHFLAPRISMCAFMFRINLPRLCWAIENLEAGHPVNVVEVDPETAEAAFIAVQRMLEVR
jgi:quinolinate synthase